MGNKVDDSKTAVNLAKIHANSGKGPLKPTSFTNSTARNAYNTTYNQTKKK
jgi:hypothetical protein